jgi:hypothetical protein
LLGFAADLKHRLGVSYRKCSSILVTLAGLVVASAALVRREAGIVLTLFAFGGDSE